MIKQKLPVSKTKKPTIINPDSRAISCEYC